MAEAYMEDTAYPALGTAFILGDFILLYGLTYQLSLKSLKLDLCGSGILRSVYW
jgi:hypothetical protein